MARQDVTVELPVNNPGETAILLGKIAARNTELALDSPIQNDFNWLEVADSVTQITTMVKEAIRADRKAQSLHFGALSLMGLAANQNLQTPKTLYPLVVKVRDILLVKNQDNPEALSIWGFNVVVNTTGGKRTVVVDIPVESPEVFIQLCEDIAEEHTNLGASSPLNGKLDMTFFTATTSQADINFTAAAAKRALSETKNAQAMEKAGYAPGQSSETPGTGYNLITNMRDLLLVAYSAPKELSLWGFKVEVGSTAYHAADEPTPPPPPVV